MPVITISRMYGSGGSAIAGRVARELGWHFFDNELVDAVAQRSGLSRAEVEEHEERVPSIVERVAAALTLGSPEVIPPEDFETTEERLVAVTQRVIEEAVQAGPCVVVGRGAHSLLAGREDALHVFCHAPKGALVRATMARHGLSEDAAARLVADKNHQRELYAKRHFNRNWRSAENYHLCLDTAFLGVDQAAQIIVAAARHRFPA